MQLFPIIQGVRNGIDSNREPGIDSIENKKVCFDLDLGINHSVIIAHMGVLTVIFLRLDLVLDDLEKSNNRDEK